MLWLKVDYKTRCWQVWLKYVIEYLDAMVLSREIACNKVFVVDGVPLATQKYRSYGLSYSVMLFDKEL